MAALCYASFPGFCQTKGGVSRDGHRCRNDGSHSVHACRCGTAWV